MYYLGIKDKLSLLAETIKQLPQLLGKLIMHYILNMSWISYYNNNCWLIQHIRHIYQKVV